MRTIRRTPPFNSGPDPTQRSCLGACFLPQLHRHAPPLHGQPLTPARRRCGVRLPPRRAAHVVPPRLSNSSIPHGEVNYSAAPRCSRSASRRSLSRRKRPFFFWRKFICGPKVCLQDRRVKKSEANSGRRVCVFSWMGAEATVADLAPGYGGQMGPSGPTIYPSTRFFFLFFVWFFFPKPKRSFSHRRPRLGGLINQKSPTQEKLPTGLLIYNLGVMVLSGVVSAPERSDKGETNNMLTVLKKGHGTRLKLPKPAASQQQTHGFQSRACSGEFITAIHHITRRIIDL